MGKDPSEADRGSRKRRKLRREGGRGGKTRRFFDLGMWALSGSLGGSAIQFNPAGLRGGHSSFFNAR